MSHHAQHDIHSPSAPLTQPLPPEMWTPTAAARLLASMTEEGLTGRALGGLAVALRCPIAGTHGPLARPYSDLDLVVDRNSAHRLTAYLAQLDYAPDAGFNAVHGRRRLSFTDVAGRHLDVFVDGFSMCHSLNLRRRLGFHTQTLAPADLLLTKMQVAELNHKDLTDVVALLADIPLSNDEAAINLTYLTGVVCADWGWWRTFTANLDLISQHLESLPVPAAARACVATALSELRESISHSRKALRWKMRGLAGERVPWRDDPEDRLG